MDSSHRYWLVYLIAIRRGETGFRFTGTSIAADYTRSESLELRLVFNAKIQIEYLANSLVRDLVYRTIWDEPSCYHRVE